MAKNNGKTTGKQLTECRRENHEPDANKTRSKTVESAVASDDLEKLEGRTLAHMLPLPVDMAALDEAALSRISRGVAAGDPLEHMLVAQLAWCHERVRMLSICPIKPMSEDRWLFVHDQCDKAMNAYRRGMLALAEYRRLKQQANLTDLRGVVASMTTVSASPAEDGRREENVTNELGANHGDGVSDRGESGEQNQVARPHAGRNGAAARGGKAKQTLAPIDWTAHRSR